MNVSDATVERLVANLLRTGVLLSALVVLAGGICYMVHHGRQVADYRNFHGVSAEYRSIAPIVKGASTRNCPAIIQLGLLLLIATPVARVAFTLVTFVLEKDRVYTVVTAMVLAILFYGLFGEH